jgi:hypothetical protein
MMIVVAWLVGLLLLDVFVCAWLLLVCWSSCCCWLNPRVYCMRTQNLCTCLIIVASVIFVCSWLVWWWWNMLMNTIAAYALLMDNFKLAHNIHAVVCWLRCLMNTLCYCWTMAAVWTLELAQDFCIECVGFVLFRCMSMVASLPYCVFFLLLEFCC